MSTVSRAFRGAPNKSRGIYVIENVTKKRYYIGQSVDMARRWAEHLAQLSQGKHHNKSLQKDFNEQGIKDFTFRVLEETPEDLDLLEREKHYISQYKRGRKKLYNVMAKSSAKFDPKKRLSTKPYSGKKKATKKKSSGTRRSFSNRE